MIDLLKSVENRYDELNHKLSEPSVISKQDEYKKLLKEYSSLQEIITKYRTYKKLNNELNDAHELLDEKPDDDFREMLEAEIEKLKADIEETKKELKILLIPKDPNDEKNVIIEIRGGAGGEEAALFAGNLFRMYSMYSESRGWKVEILNSNETEIGGFKEIIFSIEGNAAYSRLKFESGVHRVQRVPETESSGRIHTSTVTVAVLPEVEDVDVEINDDDLQIDTYRSSGAGGQHVNKTDSAIRITHIPSGIVVTCQDQRSQHKNKDRAMKILRSKLYDIALSEKISEVAQKRKKQVGTGDRSERIRTYNFPQRRVTDHRIGLTLYKIEEIMNGNLDEIIDALITTEQAEKLSGKAGDENY
jgi:peptide chain release factor 1